MDVAESDVEQRLELHPDLGHGSEEPDGLVDRHLEDVGDRATLVVDLQRLAVVALALADLAGDVDVGQELHLDLEDPVALAVLAPATLDVEAEPPRTIAADARLGDAGEQLADRREEAGIGGRVGARGPPDGALVDLDDLVDVLGALQPVVRAHRLARSVELACEGPVEDLRDERALAAPRHAGHGRERGERHPQVDRPQVVLAGPADRDGEAVAAAALPGNRHRAFAAEIGAGDGPGFRQERLERPVGDDLATVLAGQRADVDDPVGGTDRLLVVLHDEDRVAQVAETGQGGDELGVVALVEPDGRLVEDIEDPHQRRPDLGRQADSLGLAAGQRHAGPIERQVVQPDVDQEADAGRDLLEHLVGDRPLALVELRRELADPGERVGHRRRRDIVDRFPIDRHRQDLGAEALPAAGGARPRHHVSLELGLDVVRLGLPVAALEVGDDPLERRDIRVLAALVAVANDNLLILGRVEQAVDRLPGQVADRHADVPAVRLEDRLDDLHSPRRVGRHPRPGHHASLDDADRTIRDDEIGVDFQLGPETRALGTRPVRRIEREVAWLEVVDREPVVGARVALRIALFREVHRLAVAGRRRDQDHAVPQPERGLHGIGEPARVRIRDDPAGFGVDRPAVGSALRAIGRLGVAHDVSIHDDVDRVALVLVELGRFREVDHGAVDARAHETLLSGRLEDPVTLGLAVLDQRAEDEQSRSLRQRQHLVDDLLCRLPLDPMTVRAVRDADPREQQAQVVVDLGHRADRGPRVAARALLVDGNGRRQPVDLVDVGLLHLSQELARIGTQALDVTALAFGVDRVEGEARLPAPAEAGDDHEAVARERDGHIAQVVLAGAANDDLIEGHDGHQCTRTGRNGTGVLAPGG